MAPSQLSSENTTICHDWQLSITADMVLQRQGAPPDQVRRRQPRLVALAERAVAVGVPLLRPQVAYRILPVQQIERLQVILQNDVELRSAWIAQKLAGAKFLIVAVATIGPGLEAEALSSMKEDPAFALALDGCGTAAVGALIVEMRRFFTERTKEVNLTTSAPAYPGTHDWGLREAQTALFSIVDASAIGVRLTSSFLMTPCKSVSLVIGVGNHMQPAKQPCEECGASETCRHKLNEH